MMSCPPRVSPCLSWKEAVCIFFLPFISSGVAPRVNYNKHPVFGEAKPHLHRFNWSHLNPVELKDRAVGLQIESTADSNPYFTLAGHKFLIFGGSIHYFRVPRAYWRDRLLKLKACGFNTVTTYVPWNLHEPQRGTFDFSGNLDLESFVLMASEIGLWVILRPGPYICSEIDLGGLPSWLLQDPELKLRTTHKGFLNAVNKYFDHLIARVVRLQTSLGPVSVRVEEDDTFAILNSRPSRRVLEPSSELVIGKFGAYRHGGPIIAVQVENEYGSFNKDEKYMPYLQKALLKRGIVEMLLTSDEEKLVPKGRIKGVLATFNVNSFQEDAVMRFYKVQRNKPIMIMEYWVGWFDTWGSKQHKVKGADDVEKTVSEFIRLEISFNIYMFHGGTNFGFINGAINYGTHTTIVTSYDYDAVLTEAGDYTEKYFKLRKLFGSVLAFPLPPLPELTPKAVYPCLRPSFYLPLWDALPYLNEPLISNKPVNMENLLINNGSGQSYGFVLYETSICSGGDLHAVVQDTAQVFLNEERIGILTYIYQNLGIPKVRECHRLRILVENQGRVNFSWKIQDQQKGLMESVTLNNIPLKGFTIYSLEMKASFFARLRRGTWRPVPNSFVGPAFYLGTLKAGSSPKDTFLSLKGWNYGFVFINGRNLGRYWYIGPQKTLYLPGAWLHPENNEIILFEGSQSGSYIQTTDKPML